MPFESHAALAPIEGLESLSPADLGYFRDALVRVAYDATAIERAEAIVPRQFDGIRLPIVEHHLARESTERAVLMLLFAYQRPVARASLDAILGASFVDALARASILAIEDDRVRARYVLMPLDDLVVLSDPLASGRDAVMGPGITTLQLASAMRAEAGATFLDVGTGAGSLALLAARKGARATGTDISARAIALARWNARMNELEVEWHVGDGFAPVAGRTFDRIVSQPPFVVSVASHGATFLHGGERGDELAMRILVEAPRHLAPCGVAIVRVDVPVVAGDPLTERVRRGLGDAPVDVLAFASPGASLDLQAIAYAQLADQTLGAAYAEVARAYREKLGSLGFESTSQALVVLANEPASAGHYALTLTPPSLRRIDADAIDDMRRSIAVVAAGPRALEGARLVLPAGTTLVEERTLGADDARLSVRFVRGPAGDQTVNATTAALLESFAAPATFDEGVARFADSCGARPHEVRDQVLAFVRDALVRGMLQVERT